MSTPDYTFHNMMQVVRQEQRVNWAQDHDDGLSTHDWVAHVVRYLARGLETDDPIEWGRRLVQVAALCQAAWEATDRQLHLTKNPNLITTGSPVRCQVLADRCLRCGEVQVRPEHSQPVPWVCCRCGAHDVAVASPGEEETWRRRREQEPDGTSHPCDHWRPEVCCCRGSCSCHWRQP